MLTIVSTIILVSTARELELAVKQTSCVAVQMTEVSSGSGVASIDVVQDVDNLTRWYEVCLQFATPCKLLHLAFVINLFVVVHPYFMLFFRPELG